MAVTSVIASYFPSQRKIVFIICHAHSARQGPLESIPKSQREEALHLNSRLASNTNEGEEEDRREGKGVWKKQRKLIINCVRTTPDKCELMHKKTRQSLS